MESQVPAGVIYTKSQTPWSHSRWRVKLQDAIDTRESSSCVSFTLESQAPGCAIDTGESGSVHAFDDKEHGFLIQLCISEKKIYLQKILSICSVKDPSG